MQKILFLLLLPLTLTAQQTAEVKPYLGKPTLFSKDRPQVSCFTRLLLAHA